jgi:hypothetical protein
MANIITKIKLKWLHVCAYLADVIGLAINDLG